MWNVQLLLGVPVLEIFMKMLSARLQINGAQSPQRVSFKVAARASGSLQRVLSLGRLVEGSREDLRVPPAATVLSGNLAVCLAWAPPSGNLEI